MKLKLLLLLTLLLTITLALFPDVAEESMRIEALGWQFESKQGAFVILVLVLLFVVMLVQRLVLALMAGPGQLWQTLRSGGVRRREQSLQEALAQYVDMRSDAGQKKFKKARALLPEWGKSLLDVLSVAPHAQALPHAQQDALTTAFSARLATDPEWSALVDDATRKAHLDAWLHVHPDAPLAQVRLLDLYLEGKHWKPALELLSGMAKQPLRSDAWLQAQKVRTCLALAQAEPENSPSYLRQAERIAPNYPDLVIALGEQRLQAGDVKEAEKIWLNHLKKHDDLKVAEVAFKMLQSDAMAAFRRIEKVKGSDALQWLSAVLAHAAKLDGLAQESLSELLERRSDTLFWQTQAQWYAQKGEYPKSMEAYERAIEQAREIG